MKRIEIEIDDETDALLEAMMSAGESSKPAILRRLVEDGVHDMARSRQFNGVDSSLTHGPNGSTGRPPDDPERARDEDGGREDSDPPWKPLKMATMDEVWTIIEAEKTREREGIAPDSGDDLTPPDPLDALVGKLRGDRVNDIDEVVYGR
jgi:hypothetical protein